MKCSTRELLFETIPLFHTLSGVGENRSLRLLVSRARQILYVCVLMLFPLLLTDPALSAPAKTPGILADTSSESGSGEPAFLTSGRPALRILYTANTRGALHPCPS